MNEPEALKLAKLIEVAGNLTPSQLREIAYSPEEYRGRSDPALRRRSRGLLIADALWQWTKGFTDFNYPPPQ